MTDRHKAVQKAERCFALARSTTFDGERESAISRGLAICEREGLDPDSFEIPGRTPSRPQSDLRDRERATIYRRQAGFDFSRSFHDVDVADLMRKFQETMRKQETEATRQRRAEAEEIAKSMAAMQEHVTREKRKRWPTPESAADFLFLNDVPVYDLGDDLVEMRWFVPSRDGAQLNDDQLRDLADEVAGT